MKTKVIKNNTLLRLTLCFAILFLNYRYWTGKKHFPLVCKLFGLKCPLFLVQGQVHEGYEGVVDQFKLNFEEGLEIGARFTAFHKDKRVVDIYSGYHDRFFNKPYTDNSLQLVFSSSKFVEGVVVAYLVDKKILDYDMKISSVWPEFGNGNKENVTLKDLLGHRGGVTWLDKQPTLSDIGNLDRMANILASQKHNFNGTKTQGYHAVTRGWYLNEIVRRTANKSMGDLIKQEIMPLLDIEYYLNTPENVEFRVSPLLGNPALRTIANLILPDKYKSEPLPQGFKALLDRKSIGFKALNSSPKQIVPFPHSHNRKQIWRSESPSFSGITNSFSLAKLAAMMANNGTIENIQLISPETILQSLYPQEWMQDTVVTRNVTFSNGGFGLDFVFPGSEKYKWIGWGGIGGSMVWFNPEKQLAFSYVMNACSFAGIGDKRSWRLVSAFVKAVEQQS
ncbi:hypothetical protein HK103_005171 [Boothiomyces macroporosus]|uniref:Beta-lactamase-related domain-containing protein n=1 Tax=Boothiomyces macroporosus TaxID=261099 RepID=A0AAD5UI97_9FUNG|nr:hypothetical protein HK103_005171 [Boothiomyces macroporosus]